MTNGIWVEVCCGSLADCIAAERAGADAIELVSTHLLGGITPSAGLVQKARERVSLPISVILRPRGAGFCYSDEDYAVMCEDAQIFSRMGVNGIVFGFLTPDGKLDNERCARFMEFTGNCETVFHRAIDVVPDLPAAAERLVALGVTRVLTSGGCASALEGASAIRGLVDAFGNRIQVLAGGGIRSCNVAQIIEQTGVRRVHFAGTGNQSDSSTSCNPTLNFGVSVLPPLDSYIAVQEPTVMSIIAAIETDLSVFPAPV